MDPYKTLGVDRSSPAEVIEAAYRALAKKYHPDRNPGEVNAARFREIHTAYELLRDPLQRTIYDRTHPPRWEVWSSASIDPERAPRKQEPPPQSESTRPSRSVAATWKIALVVLGLVLAVGIVGFAVADPETSGAPPADTTEVAKYRATLAAKAEAINVQHTRIAELNHSEVTPTPDGKDGKTGTSGSWRITLESSELRPTVGEQGNIETAKGIFLIVNFSLENTGRQPYTFPILNLRVIDSEGRVYSTRLAPTFVHMAYQLGVNPADEVLPTIPYTFAAVFDVPVDAHGFRFTSRAGNFTINLDQ